MPVVLVVEDDPDIATLVTLSLEDADFEVLQARDGLRALELAAEHHVDLVLLDIRLPKMGGEEVAQELRRREITPPIVVFSASADLPAIAARTGAVAYLSKPFDIEHLTDLAARVLAEEPVT